MFWEEIFQFQDSQDIRLVKSNNENNQNTSKFKQLQFNRILLKISGEVLAGNNSFGINPESTFQIAKKISLQGIRILRPKKNTLIKFIMVGI